LLTKVPKSAQPHVATQVRAIFDQADAAAVHAQFDRVVAALADYYSEAAEHLETARDQLLTFIAYPRELWRQIWSNNPRSDSTKKSTAAPTSSASSPTGLPSSGSSALSWPNTTTNGPVAKDSWRKCFPQAKLHRTQARCGYRKA
jgi:putative transposase